MKHFRNIFFLILLFFVFTLNVNAFEYNNINSKYVYLYDLDNNEVLYNKDSDKKIAIASLTKIMTVIVALDKVDDVNKKVILSNKAFTGLYDAAVAGFKEGEEVTYLDLFYGAMLPSGADAAQAIATSVSGSINSYVELMNTRAKELGLDNTHFGNVTGLDEEGAYSTVEDVFKILKYALNNTTFKKIFTAKLYTSTNGISMHSTLVSYSKNTGIDTKYILGTKTGYTDDAKLCLASLSNTGDMNMALVTCGAYVDSKKTSHIRDAVNIYKYYSDEFKEVSLLEKGDLIASIKTKYDKHEFINFYSDKEIKKILPKAVKEEDIKVEYNGVNLLTTKNKVNENLGIVSIKYGKNIYYTTNVILKDEIKFNIFRFIKENWFILLLVLFLSLFVYTKILKRIKKRKKRMEYRKYNPKMFDFR